MRRSTRSGRAETRDLARPHEKNAGDERDDHQGDGEADSIDGTGRVRLIYGKVSDSLVV
jgi:hypothetical protein